MAKPHCQAQFSGRAAKEVVVGIDIEVRLPYYVVTSVADEVDWMLTDAWRLQLPLHLIRPHLLPPTTNHVTHAR